MLSNKGPSFFPTQSHIDHVVAGCEVKVHDVVDEDYSLMPSIHQRNHDSCPAVFKNKKNCKILQRNHYYDTKKSKKGSLYVHCGVFSSDFSVTIGGVRGVKCQVNVLMGW